MTKEHGFKGGYDSFVETIKKTYNNWRDDRTLRLGAGLAYYVVFSIAPITALSVAIASYIFPREDVVAYLQERAAALFGGNVAQVSSYIEQSTAPETVDKGIFGLGVLGLVTLVITASFALLALQDSINMIWGKPVKKGFHYTVKRYTFSYILVLGVALILVATLTVRALVQAVENFLPMDGSIVQLLGSAFTSIATWIMLAAALAWLTRILTSNRVSWKIAAFGSMVTIVFMYVGVFAIGYYLKNFGFNSVSSVFGAVMLVLVWVYYESQILLAGFQLTKTLSQEKRGS